MIIRPAGSIDEVASLWLTLTEHPWDFGDRVGRPETLGVLPSARGRGLGTALVGAVRAHWRAAGVGFGLGDRLAAPEAGPAFDVRRREVLERTFDRLNVGAEQAVVRGPEDHWQGWEGARGWRSLGGELTVEAVHDGRAQVTLSATVRARQSWSATLAATLEAGEQMAALARDVRALLS